MGTDKKNDPLYWGRDRRPFGYLQSSKIGKKSEIYFEYKGYGCCQQGYECEIYALKEEYYDIWDACSVDCKSLLENKETKIHFSELNMHEGNFSYEMANNDEWRENSLYSTYKRYIKLQEEAEILFTKYHNYRNMPQIKDEFKKVKNHIREIESFFNRRKFISYYEKFKLRHAIENF